MLQSQKTQQKEKLDQLKRENLSQYAIKGSEDEWGKALNNPGTKNIISVKR
jgi:N-acetyltransferase 10